MPTNMIRKVMIAAKVNSDWENLKRKRAERNQTKLTGCTLDDVDLGVAILKVIATTFGLLGKSYL